MKIQTEDCVKSIVDYFYKKNNRISLTFGSLTDLKAWKRLSKTGSGDSIKRTFQNKKTGDIVYVMSTETEILSVSETDVITKFENFSKVNVKEQLESIIQKLKEDFEEDFEDFGGLYYNSKLNAVWLDVCDGFEPENEVEVAFLTVVSKVIIEYEKEPNSNGWVKIEVSNKYKYVLEVLDFKKSKEEWQKEMYQDEGVNIGIIVWLADDIECMCDRDIPDCLPELEELDLGEVMLDDNGFLALESELTVTKIKQILKKEGFKLK